MSANLTVIRAFTALCLTVTLLAGCSKNDDTYNSRRDEQSFNVVVEPVQMSNQRTRVEAVGTSRAIQSIVLYPAASGEVVAMYFKPGQFVKKAAKLLELDQRDAKLAVQLAEVRVADAKRLYDRYLRSADSGATLPTTLDAAKATLQAAEIELDRARVNLDDRTIIAPFSGYVGITDVDVGDRIQNSTLITSLDNRESLLVSFEVPELLVGRINTGDKIAINTWNANAVAATGEIIELDSRIDPQTRTFITRALVDNKDDRLRPGMSFRVQLDLAGDSYPVLSEVSLQWGAEGSYVWSVVEGKAQRVPVNIVQRQQGKILVEANLNPNDRIVVEGLQRLRPGIGVNPQATAIADDSPAPEVDDNIGPGPG